MTMINSVNAVDVATMAANPSPSESYAPTDDKINEFNKLLFAGTPQGGVGNLSPTQMLVQQATTLGTTVGVDLGAKIAGAVSQSVNKLANMT
ncbi:MAG: type III secretion system inner rod subunit SctI [Kluyvera sp.]